MKIRLWRDCTVALGILAIACGSAWAQDSAEVAFSILTRSGKIGSESVAVVRNADGWIVRGSGRSSSTVDQATRRFEARYDANWRPVALTSEALVQGLPVVVRLTFKDGLATGELAEAKDISTGSLQLSPDVVLLSDAFLGSYEALTARLAGATAGATIPAYYIRQGEFGIRVDSVTDERIQTPVRTIQAKRYRLTLMSPASPIPLDVWADERARLLRMRVAGGPVEIVRDDIATVETRQQLITRAGDEDIRVPANGFTLAATLSRPQAQPTKVGFPAVVLVPGAGPQDRDEVLSDIPIFGQLASALADAGFIVVRYDKRGLGLSGGRPESVALSDYADDARAVVKYLKDRKDVDDKRITLVGYREGGWTALLAGSREKDARAIVLLATPGVTGNELVLDQQQRALASLSMPAEEKLAKVELQKKINAAVSSGAGWDELPEDLRQQAETPWFQSLLTFDPTVVMRKLRQPVLAVRGELDREVAAESVERLVAAGRERKADRQTDTLLVPGVNHLLVPATTGEPTEYGTLKGATVAPAVVSALTGWMEKMANAK